MSRIVLQMKHISKSYKDGEGKNMVLEDVSLSVREGEVVAVVGPSGSGKSTFLSIAGALLSADNGNIIIGNEDISDKKRKEWGRIRKERIGFIFQTHNLLPYLTAGEQLTDVVKGDKKSRDRQERAAKLLEEVGLKGCLRKYPAQMSGGERQRVAIARAFMNEPEIILADEPTASLDASRGKQIGEMIRQEVKKRNKAAVIVTHDERLLEYADTVYRLNGGRLERVS